MKGKLLSLNLRNKRQPYASFDGPLERVMDRDTRFHVTWVDASIGNVLVNLPKGGLYQVNLGD